MAALAAEVAGHLPGWHVGSATLADREALRRAFAAAPQGRALVYPMFMSDGWFVSSLLPKRLAAAGGEARLLAPFGLDPALPALCARRAEEAAQKRGLDLSRTTLVVAAHGSPNDPRAGAAARAAAERIAAEARPAATRVCFVDEPPFLAEGLSVDGPAICLPFFATAASHVLEDLPEAVEQARFTGPVLEPVGQADGVPALIARGLTAAVQKNP